MSWASAHQIPVVPRGAGRCERGGACCVKHGVTTDYVFGLQVVLADGRLRELGGQTVKHVAGYDVKRLFVGSVGTLGIVTEVTLRLRPAPPAAVAIVASFADVGASSGGSHPPGPRHRLWRAAPRPVGRGWPAGLDEIHAVIAHCQAGEDEQFMAARRMAIPSVERLGTVLIEDVGVPIPQVAALVEGVAALSDKHETVIATIGHTGDGTFHHGVGTLKRPWLMTQLGEDVLGIQRQIKAL